MMKIEDFLEKFRGGKVFYNPNPGNGGDAIIAYATFRLFKKLDIAYEVVQEDTDLQGQDVLYGGGGNFIENYNEAAGFVRKNHGKCRSLTILSHTVAGHEDLLRSLGSNVSIICREKNSFDYVNSFENISNVYLMDDLALSLQFDPSDLRYTLVNRLIFLSNLKDTLWYLYHRRRPLSYYLKNRNSTKVLNAFRLDSEKTSLVIPSDSLDVSAAFNFDSTMKRELLVEKTALTIASFLNQFDTINTNRLHICITGALLGKKINFYGNSYWKNESIYEYSLRHRFPNIHWQNNVSV